MDKRQRIVSNLETPPKFHKSSFRGADTPVGMTLLSSDKQEKNSPLHFHNENISQANRKAELFSPLCTVAFSGNSDMFSIHVTLS